MHIFFLTIFVGLLLNNSSYSHAKKAYCEAVEVPTQYLGLKEFIQKKIKEFSNKKYIAEEADTVLSKLISENSPTIIQWIDKRNLRSKPEEEVVYEWREYYAKNFILSKYPHTNKNRNQEIESLVKEIKARFVTKEFKSQMNKILVEVKQKSITTIESFKLSKTQKKEIINRIRSIQLFWFENLKIISKSKKRPLEFIDWGIAYDPVTNKINMGVDALSYNNADTYYAIFAHEIGHAFDSCRWGAFFSGDWPFQKIGECLRSEKSIGAKFRDSSKLDQFVADGKLSTEMAQALKLNPTCNQNIYPPIGLQADQLPEAFADWFSAEVVAQKKKINIKHFRSDLCVEKELVEGSSYPSNLLRITKIYFAHPKLKERIVDKNLPSFYYCAF